MKKDATRDYTTEIFRTYAAAGFPTYKETRKHIYEAELAKRKNMDVAKAVAEAEKATEKKTPFLLDILAAEKTIELLIKGNRVDIVSAVKAVYMVFPTQPLHRGDITERVRRFAVECPADTSTVYRWLREARLLCASIRGLTISEEDIEYDFNCE